MSQRNLTCQIPDDLYHRYRAALPDGESVNSHLRSLVERYVHEHSIDFSDASFAARVYDPNLALEPQTRPVCLHPRGSLRRQGHTVFCTICDQPVVR